MLCATCKKLLEPFFKYCPYCGVEVLNESKRKKYWGRASVVIACGMLLFFLLAAFTSDDLLKTVEEQLSALNNDRITEAYYQYASDDYKENISLIAFKEMVTAFPVLTKNKNIEVIDKYENDQVASVRVMLTSLYNESIPVEYQLVRDDEGWKIDDMLLQVPSQAGASQKGKISWLTPIDQQLQALRQNNFQAAYDATSTEFKSATSLEEFTQFVSSHPLFTAHREISIKNQSIQEQEADILLLLNPGPDQVAVHYLLKQENDQWKIWAMSVISEFTAETQALLKDTNAMIEPVRAQLEKVKEGETSKAYYQFTSKEFRDRTSLDQFKEVVTNFPPLLNWQEIEFKDPIVVDKTTALVEVILHSEGEDAGLEFTLGIENDKWKVWAVRVTDRSAPKYTQQPTVPTTPIPETPRTPIPEPPRNIPAVENEGNSSVTSFRFAKVEVGTGLDLKGNVVNPSDDIKSPFGDLYVNLYVQNGVKRAKVEMFLEHEESHSALPKVSTTLQQDGDSKLSFSFSPPPQGWPKGKYRIVATSTTGDSREFKFKIE